MAVSALGGALVAPTVRMAGTAVPNLANILKLGGIGGVAAIPVGAYLHGRSRGAKDPDTAGLGSYGYPIVGGLAGLGAGLLTRNPNLALAGLNVGAGLGQGVGALYGAGHHHGRANTIRDLQAQLAALQGQGNVDLNSPIYR